MSADTPTDVVWPIHSVSGPGSEKRIHWGTRAQAEHYVEHNAVPPGCRIVPCVCLRAAKGPA